jgi:hypothetical protein
VAETIDKEPQAEAPNETQLYHQPVALSRLSIRRPAIVGALFALLVIGAAAYDLPMIDVVLPNFPSFAELSLSKTASAPIPDSAVGLLANCPSRLPTKCSDPTHDVLHSTTKCSRPLGRNVAQKNISVA